MISIGSFVFPTDKTFFEIKMMEAKSKVRKEILISSLLQDEDANSPQESLNRLQASVEAFDRGEARLSLHEGRYYEGRRREFEILPDVHHQLAFIKLSVFTLDRFERSIALHQIEQDLFFGFLALSVWNQGNWLAPPKITITPDADISELTIKNDQVEFRLEQSLSANIPIVIDSGDKSVHTGEEKLNLSNNAVFPMLIAGRNPLEIQLTPNTANAAISIQYQDIWV